MHFIEADVEKRRSSQRLLRFLHIENKSSEYIQKAVSTLASHKSLVVKSSIMVKNTWVVTFWFIRTETFFYVDINIVAFF